MTLLPQQPANFSATENRTAEEAQRAQEDLEEAQRKVEELLSQLEGYSQQLQNLRLNLSAGAQIRENIIRSTVDPLFNFGCINLELPSLQLSLLANLYLLASRIPTIPAIPAALKLAIGLQISVPLEVPTIAEFRQYINAKIEEAKIKCQQQIISRELADALAEDTPFTARQDAQNNTARSLSPDQSCIVTETGATEEEALRKAEFKLKRVLRCCECCGNTSLTKLSSKQENGVFIVTAGILES
jgi:hypothetical protein